MDVISHVSLNTAWQLWVVDTGLRHRAAGDQRTTSIVPDWLRSCRTADLSCQLSSRRWWHLVVVPSSIQAAVEGSNRRRRERRPSESSAAYARSMTSSSASSQPWPPETNVDLDDCSRLLCAALTFLLYVRTFNSFLFLAWLFFVFPIDYCCCPLAQPFCLQSKVVLLLRFRLFSVASVLCLSFYFNILRFKS